MNDHAYLLALHTVDGLGPNRLKLLIDYFGSAEAAWKADVKSWQETRVGATNITNWQQAKTQLDIPNYVNRLASNGIHTVTFFDEQYPELLKEIHDPPLILYFKGDLSALNQKCLAVVGTRTVSQYGKQVTVTLTTELVAAGLVIVSGLARGVDTLAHRTTVENNGTTVAVLGGGLFNLYPKENTGLAERILETGGVVMSENPPDYPNSAGLFPARNRIISGLSLGVLVTEAAQDSGSLITARMALEQGRDVFAVPGPITSSLSKGPSELIKQGAVLVSSAEDILGHLNITSDSVAASTIEFDPKSLEGQLLTFLQEDSKHLDELVRSSKKPSFEVSACLIRLEIQGVVKNIGNGMYIRL